MCNHSNHYHEPFKGLEHEGHNEEHRAWSRRSFMQTLGIAGSGTMFLGSHMLTAAAPSRLSAAIGAAEGDNILILIRLNGGNDGLNTVIPLEQYDRYRQVRPNIYLPESKIIQLTDEFGIPSFMEPTEALWGEGMFKAVHGVGYQNQNLSHFTGSDIWANTDLTTTGLTGEDTGWMGRYFEDIYPNYLLESGRPDFPAAIQIGNINNLVFQGEETNYAFITNNVDQLEQIAQSGFFYNMDPALFNECMYHDQLRYLRGVANTTYEYAGDINQAYEAGSNEIEYQDNNFARQMALLARLIKGGLGTRVYMVSMGGFDTHGNQPIVHERLMSNLTRAVQDFYTDLEFSGVDERVLSMTFSEFGRRVFENGSVGTDHGKAAPTLFFGKGLQGSAFVGTHPEIWNTDRDEVNGTLEPNVDFRDLYGTVLAEWLCVDPVKVQQHLLNHDYTPIDLGFRCHAETEFNDDVVYDNDPPDIPDTPPSDGSDPGADPGELTQITHGAYYPDQINPHIEFNLPESSPVEVNLYNVIGQKVGVLYQGTASAGSTQIDVKQSVNAQLPSGRYVYQMIVNGEKMSKSIIIQ